jgi:hypothetical protein
MKNLRTYGKAPFSVAVIHGGPGGGGEAAPVARDTCFERFSNVFYPMDFSYPKDSKRNRTETVK